MADDPRAIAVEENELQEQNLVFWLFAFTNLGSNIYIFIFPIYVFTNYIQVEPGKPGAEVSKKKTISQRKNLQTELFE